MSPLITFTSDFGLTDSYVGTVHAVIAGIAPQARVLDLTHGVPPQDIVAGALALYAACPYFPPGTIHLAVVDPGVGTRRRPLLIATATGWFVGPDNGLFSLAAPPDTIIGCWELADRRYQLATVSATFHGRDIFGPAAAHLANGVPPAAFGPPAPLPLAHPELTLQEVGPGETVGIVLAADHFGNLTTNLRAPRDWPARVAAGRVRAWLDGRPLRPAVTYGAASSDPDVPTPLLLAGSAGLLEVAVAGGSAALTTGAGRGAPVRVEAKGAPPRMGDVPLPGDASPA